MAKIIGGTASTTMPVPDWEQTNPRRADYIKNKPVIETPEDNSCGLQMVDPWEPNDNDGTFSTALGSANRIGDGANYSLASGFENEITGKAKQTALGLRNILTGDTDTAIGRYNTIGALVAVGIGERNDVHKDNAIAIGYGLSPSNEKQVVVGRFNAPNENAVFIIGNGSTDRCNAMTVQADGSITVGGRFEDVIIRPALRGTDRFSSYANDAKIGDGVTISNGITCNGKKTACFLVNDSDKPYEASQANIEDCYVTAGDTYRLTMRVYSAYSNVRTAQSWFWVAIVGENEAGDNLNIGSYAKSVVHEDAYKIYKNDAWTDVDVTFTPEKSGMLRIGFMSGNSATINPSAVGNKYFVGNVALNNETPKPPVYNYASVSGNRHETLYRVADVPCDVEHIKSWLIGKTISTEYGDITITESIVSNNLDDWHDAGKNYIVLYNNVVLMCVVDSIVPREMDVKRLGVYVPVRVNGVPLKRWVDNPIALP